MITYSRQDVERQLIADDSLWRRVPAAVSALLWPLEVAILGWATGWWAGILTVIGLAVASTLLPPRLHVSIYLIDLIDRLLQLPLNLCWLGLVCHLWLREPLFTPFGQPLLGALAVTLCLSILARLLAFLSRYASKRMFTRQRG